LSFNFQNWKFAENLPFDPKNYEMRRLPVYGTLQMFTGIYRDSVGKSECGEFKFMGIACIPVIPVILKSSHSDFHVKIVGILTLQGYYGDTQSYIYQVL
jgi:hypothetical protein